jgi:hypothetical protein
VEEFLNMLKAAVINFHKWDSEGRPKHGSEQFYYDNYHDHIERTDQPNVYYFDVQTFDSPDFDTWVSGTVEISDSRCRIISSKSYRN